MITHQLVAVPYKTSQVQTSSVGSIALGAGLQQFPNVCTMTSTRSGTVFGNSASPAHTQSPGVGDEKGLGFRPYAAISPAHPPGPRLSAEYGYCLAVDPIGQIHGGRESVGDKLNHLQESTLLGISFS